MTPTISGNPALLATDNGHYYIPGNGLHSYHINNTDGLNLYKNFSGATWIWVGKVNSTSTTQRLWGTGSGTNIIRSRCNLTSGGTISLQNRMADADTSVIVTSSSGTIVANNPYVIFGVADYTNNVQTLYVNGTSVATGIITVSGTRALPNTAPTTRFPRVLSCPVDPAVTTGRLFAFALLSNVLNSTQVAALYAAYKRKFHNLGLP